jgi:hypothetical protein
VGTVIELFDAEKRVALARDAAMAWIKTDFIPELERGSPPEVPARVLDFIEHCTPQEAAVITWGALAASCGAPGRYKGFPSDFKAALDRRRQR